MATQAKRRRVNRPRWDDDQWAQFRSLYKQYEFLWNPKYKGYFRKDEKQILVRSIAEDMGESVDVITAKIHSVRSNYSKAKNTYVTKGFGALTEGPLGWFTNYDFLYDVTPLDNLGLVPEKHPKHGVLGPGAPSATPTPSPSPAPSPVPTASKQSSSAPPKPAPPPKDDDDDDDDDPDDPTMSPKPLLKYKFADFDIQYCPIYYIAKGKEISPDDDLMPRMDYLQDRGKTYKLREGKIPYTFVPNIFDRQNYKENPVHIIGDMKHVVHQKLRWIKGSNTFAVNGYTLTLPKKGKRRVFIKPETVPVPPEPTFDVMTLVRQFMYYPEIVSQEELKVIKQPFVMGRYLTKWFWGPAQPYHFKVINKTFVKIKTIGFKSANIETVLFTNKYSPSKTDPKKFALAVKCRPRSKVINYPSLVAGVKPFETTSYKRGKREKECQTVASLMERMSITTQTELNVSESVSTQTVASQMENMSISTQTEIPDSQSVSTQTAYVAPKPRKLFLHV